MARTGVGGRRSLRDLSGSANGHVACRRGSEAGGLRRGMVINSNQLCTKEMTVSMIDTIRKEFFSRRDRYPMFVTRT